jgi:DNA helicase II / ATP-dependent DNA helicase PcrA
MRPGAASAAIEPTPEQRLVIEHPLEPVRVTAGAGTGKTSTIALRLAHLVKTHDIVPEQTLGITFTNKAVEELASRLRSCLPAQAAEGHEVQVLTYHGFAHGLLREFGPLIGVPREPRIIPTGYVRQLLRDALGSAPRPHLDLTQPGRRVDEIARLLSVLGDHLLDPADLGTADDDVAAMRGDMAAVLEEYGRRKKTLGAIDYADMVTMAHQIVAIDGVAERVRERYRIVLLDEYQDTNPGQRELLRALFGDGFPLTAVGDSDQTIYEWRGASPANFADFPIHFPLASGDPAPTLNLSINWRSATTVLDAANAVRSQIARASGIEALVPRPDAPVGAVRSHWLRTAVDEADWIAAEVGRMHDDDGRRWGDVAILFRKHRQMALVRDALAASGVPVEVASLGGLLEVPEVADLHAWLRVLGRPDDDIALARVLLGVGYRLGLGDLVPLSHWARLKRRADDEESPVGWALLESIDEVDRLDGLGDEARGRLRRFSDLYRELLEAAQGSSLVELCRLVLDRIDAWPEVDALDDAARLSARLNLFRFLDLAETWSPLEGSPSLDAFLDYLDLLAQEGADDALDTANLSGEDAVLLITVHRAKGLEWPVVFLPALCDGTFPSGVQAYDDPAKRPEVIPHHLRLDTGYYRPLPEDPDERKLELRSRHDEQEWRTAYVAVTRARDELVASGAFWYSTGRAKERSPLFEVIDGVAAPEPGRVDEPGDAPQSLHADHGWRDVPDPVFADGWQEALAIAADDPAAARRWATEAGLQDAFDEETRQLELTLGSLPEPGATEPATPGFRTSVTGAVTFASCPLRFHWSHVDRLPRRPSPAARRGTDVHRRIELHLRGKLAFDLAPTDRPAGDPDRSQSRSAFATFQASRFAGMEPILIEAPFSLLVGAGRLDGRIDAVFEPEPGLWEVVDFKSGRAGDDPARRIQLEAYALAMAEAGLMAGSIPERLRVTFAYLGDDEPVEISEDVDDAWLAEARSRIEALVESASGGERTPTPSSACRWCDFSRFCEAGRGWLEANP